jgi:L-threonylcarbamoyladenylate synthase
MAATVQFDPARDSTRVVDALCKSLEEGRIVGLSTETAYVPCVLPRFASRLVELTRRAEMEQLVVLLDDPSAFLEGFSALSSRMRRLVRRGWPGPIVIEAPVTAESRPKVAASDLEDAIDRECLRATMPVSRVIDDVTARLRQPLLSLMNFSSPMSASSTQFAERWQDGIDLIVDAGQPRFTSPPTLVGAGPEGLKVLSPGIVGEDMVHRMSARVYLFICTGNTCRSPMAEGLFRQMLATELRCSQDELITSGMLILSAGLAAPQGMPASEESVSLLKERGIDLGSHSSQPVTRELLQHSDHVFTMTARHREQILRSFPELAEQVELLSPEGVDIVDPIGGGWEDYAECLQQIEHALKHRLQTERDRED